MKKILACTLFALPLAVSAETTIYGKVKMGLENDRLDGMKSTTRIDDYGTRIGFMGNESLSPGLKVIWLAELGLRADSAGENEQAFSGNSTPAMRLRHAYVGLEGSFGKVLAGRTQNLFINNNGEFGLLDSWEYGGGTNGLGTFYRTERAINNAVRYDSPNLGGFTFAAQYGLDERNIIDTEHSKRAPVMGVAAAYKHDSGVFVGVVHERSRAYSAENTTGRHTRVEGGYKANNILAVAAYQDTRDNQYYRSDLLDLSKGNNFNSREAAITLGYQLGKVMPKVSFAKGWDIKDLDQQAGSIVNTGYTQFIVGANYNLSKRTVAEIAYGQQKVLDKKHRTLGVNMVHAF